MPAGLKLHFACKDGAVHIAVGTTASVASVKGGTCKALYDVYFGAEPISPAAKDGVAAGLALLEGAKEEL